MAGEPLTLNNNDPAVIAARNAEQQLFNHYGFKVTDHYVPLPGYDINIRVSETGTPTGTPALVVPGNTGDVFPLASLLVQLQGYRIIALNRPGGGLSEGIDHTKVNIRQLAVQSIITALDAFKVDRVDIVAHSMGAHWSLWAAMDAPQRIRSLTLLGNPGNVMQGRPPFIMRLLSKPPLNKLLFKLMAPEDKSKALRFLKAMGHSSKTIAAQPAELGDAYYFFRRLPHYFVAATSLLINAAPQIDAQQLQQVQQPVQLLLGDKDNFASVQTGQTIIDALPHGELHILKDAGHLPWMEYPAECGRLINALLAKR